MAGDLVDRALCDPRADRPDHFAPPQPEGLLAQQELVCTVLLIFQLDIFS